MWLSDGPAWTRTRDQPSTQGSGGACREVAGSGSASSFPPSSPLRLAEPTRDVWARIGHSDSSRTATSRCSHGERSRSSRGVLGLESASLRLRSDHRHLTVLVHRYDVSVGPAGSKPTQYRLLRDDDRVGISVRFDLEALLDLGLQECVESLLPSTRGVDLSSQRALLRRGGA